jgi:CMP-N,N'-diacetyllegionaminic acid synthase
MKVGALIPCRKGSKRVPGKNFRELCGKPLWKWTYDAAIKSGVFDFIVISSDGGFYSDELIVGDKVVVDNNRPAELCEDGTTMEAVLGHYVDKYPDIGIWAILQPTSPLREADDISGAYKMLVEDERDSVVSAFNDPLLFWVKDCVEVQGQQCPVASFHIDKRPNGQDRKDWYKENGAVYFTPTYTLKYTGSRCGGRVGLYAMPQERSYEIDSEHDWEICEFLLNKRLNQKEAA